VITADERETFAIFAVARFVLMNAGRTDQIADHTGLAVTEVEHALSALSGHIVPSRMGWEATDYGSLIHWAIFGYPTPTGETRYWLSDRSFGVQALRVHTAGFALSDTWAAHQADPLILGDRLTVYSERPVDLTPDGFILVEHGPGVVTAIVPDDPTLLPTARWNRPGGCTDTFITAATILAHPDRTATDDHAVIALQTLLNQQCEDRRYRRWSHHDWDGARGHE
jgi:hypothetical protein